MEPATLRVERQVRELEAEVAALDVGRGVQDAWVREVQRRHMVQQQQRRSSVLRMNAQQRRQTSDLLHSFHSTIEPTQRRFADFTHFGYSGVPEPVTQDFRIHLERTMSGPGKRPAVSKAELDALPRTSPSADNDECVICLRMDSVEKVVLPCDPKHAFHAQCLRRWFAKSRTCPICRAELPRELHAPIRTTTKSRAIAAVQRSTFMMR